MYKNQGNTRGEGIYVIDDTMNNHHKSIFEIESKRRTSVVRKLNFFTLCKSVLNNNDVGQAIGRNDLYAENAK